MITIVFIILGVLAVLQIGYSILSCVLTKKVVDAIRVTTVDLMQSEWDSNYYNDPEYDDYVIEKYTKLASKVETKGNVTTLIFSDGSSIDVTRDKE